MLRVMSDPHRPSEELAYLTAHDVLARYADGSLSATTLVEALLERITALDDDGPTGLHAVIALSDDARATAKERDDERRAGTIRGPLHGVPVLIKDNIEADGLPGTAGATALLGRPAHDAALVTTLREAGAIILGSTNMSQWANLRSTRSTSGYSAVGGLVGNPWSIDRSAGGSSSGAGAAAAAGYAPLLVGTETDGSITCPASLNGVVGLKPTVGLVSRQGIVPLSSRQDSPGPLTRSVADAGLLFSVLAGIDIPAEAPAVSMVVSSTWRTGHYRTDELFTSVMDDLRATGVSLPERPFGKPSVQEGTDELYCLLAEFKDDLAAYLATRDGEGVRSIADVLEHERANADVEFRYFRNEHLVAANDSAGTDTDEYRQCRDRITTWAVQDCLEVGLGDADVVLSPAYAPAWKCDVVLGDPHVWFNPGISVAAIAGWPIATVPMGLVDELPVGLTIMGRPHSEWKVLAAAAQIEAVVAARGWTGRPSWRNAQRG